MIKKNLLLALLFAVIQLCYGKDKFVPATCYDCDMQTLVQKLKTENRPAEKINILNGIILYNNSTVNDPAATDTNYIKQLISTNNAAHLFNDQAYKTWLSASRAASQKNYPLEMKLFKQAVEQFDSQGIEDCYLLTQMRWLFNAMKDQEGKFTYYTNKLEQYLRQKQYHNAAACYHALAGYYLYKGDVNAAINGYLKAAELFKPFSKYLYGDELLVVGRQYSNWGNGAKALIYLKAGLKKVTANKDYRMMGYGYFSIADAEFNLKHYKQSLSYITQANANTFLANDKKDQLPVEILDYIGLGYLQKAKSSLEKLQPTTKQTDVLRISHGESYTPDFVFYRYYNALHNFPKAEMYLLRCYASSADNAISKQTAFAKELAELYGNHNDLKKAWEYTILYNKLDDSVQTQVNRFKVASYENEQKESEQNHKLIKMQEQQAVQQATLHQRTLILWISLVALFIVIASLVFIYRQFQINKQTLATLKKTQSQLIQSEKMASLGDLTAGIAHEIQNPLNFVNNFSEVSVELTQELTEELKSGHIEDALAIADDLEQNLGKINHHGRRAGAIVNGMLEHSRKSTGTKEPTDINALADEYFRLSYHGLRAKDKAFNAELITNLDDRLPKANVIPQDIGRVMLNLYNNAFYAVYQKQKSSGPDYKPEVTVTTSTGNNQVIIKVKDNGNGISEGIRDKIMQPFFTTKPTGEGTGLGLSLSYDIIVKVHGGSIDVDTKECQYTEFAISLPQ